MDAKNIVVAMDFSESSEAALQLGASLARGSGATLHIVHVKEPSSAYKLGRQYGDVPPYPELETLQTVLEKVGPADPEIPCRRWLLTGEHAAKEILKVATTVRADLVILGTHGRTGLSRLLLGSVAESVVRHAPCPVLTIKHPRLEIMEAVPGPLPS